MIIAFTGLKQSGKSTASKFLQNKHGFVRVNFKDAMIKEMKETFPDFLESLAKEHKMSIDELFDQKPGNVRKFMQNYGTELRRGDDSDYWCVRWQKAATTCLFDVVVDDCRFLNEASWINANDGKIIRIVKEGQVADDSHASETEMSEIIPDYTIYCPDGQPELLEQYVDNLVEKLKSGV